MAIRGSSCRSKSLVIEIAHDDLLAAAARPTNDGEHFESSASRSTNRDSERSKVQERSMRFGCADVGLLGRSVARRSSLSGASVYADVARAVHCRASRAVTLHKHSIWLNVCACPLRPR